MQMGTEALSRRKPLMRSRCRLVAAVALFIAISMENMTTTSAHDGGFGHSQRTIAASADERGWTIEYRIGLGADEALVELAQHPEADFFDRRGRQLATTLRVTAPEGATLVFTGHSVGPALTQTYRYRLDTPAERIVLQDDCFPHKPGVVRCVGGVGVRVTLADGIDWSHAERATVEFARTR
ncbi:MAG: hypothetical protein ACKOEX_00140 [Planctomycetia bacterium]